MADVLAQVDTWEPAIVAVGVTGPDATLDTHGPADHVLPLTSVTKLLTAYGVLSAVNQGLLRLDESVRLAQAPGPITPRHLLAHASGLPPNEGGTAIEPERRRIYSNWGYELLGSLVSRQVGIPFGAHLDRELLGPLDMSATRLHGSPSHAADGSLTDLLAFGRELLSPTLLDRELFDEATSVAFPGLEGVLPGYGRQEPNDWGLGFEIKDAKHPHWTGQRLSPRTFGHFGQSGSFLWVDPELHLACAVLTDGRFGDWAVEGWPVLCDEVAAAYAP